MAAHHAVRRLRAASIVPVLALAAAAGCDDPSGTEAADRPVALAAGVSHTCALTGAGTAYCWGGNEAGQLGNASFAPSAAPVRVNAPERLTAISALHQQTCALGASGAAYCWGVAAHAPMIFIATPQRVDSPVGFASVSAGSRHACALTRDGAAYCWGSDQSGALGDGPGGEAFRNTPVAVNTTLSFRSIRAGAVHSCAITADGAPYCWGNGLFGIFGDGSTSIHPAPVAAGAGLRFTSFDPGSTWMCGISGEDVYCWGSNNAGELGRGTASAGSHREPARVSGLPAVRTVFASSQNAVVGHSCALDAAGVAYCWGENGHGEVGVAPGTAPSGICTGQFSGITCVPEPVRAAGALRFRTLALGTHHTCGITREHEIECWGRAAEGQLGPAGGEGGATPVRVELPKR